MEMYKKEGINLITRYTVEYIDNQKDLDYINSGIYKHGEPWERYKTKQFDNMDSALSIYMIYLVRSDIYDVKLFEEIILDGETVRESYIEPTSTTAYSLKIAIDRNMYEQNSKTQQQVETLEAENNLYKQFMKQYNSEKLFNDYMKQNIETKTYKYYSLERPVSLGTYPKKSNSINIVNYDTKQLIDDIGRLAWGYIEYKEPLTKNDCYEYELEPSRDAWKDTNMA